MLLRMCLVMTHLLLFPIHSWSFGSRRSLSGRTESTYTRKRIRPATISDVESTPPPLLSSRQIPNNGSSLQLGLSQLKPFLHIAVPFFQQDDKARNGLLTVFGLTLLNSGVSVAFSYISRDFYNALNARDEAVFYEKIELFFGALLVAVPVAVYYRFLREKLSLYWREALTKKVLDDYYASRTFYQLEMLREIDNPDQRIAEDVRAFTRTSLDFFIVLITSIIDLCSFSLILYEIYPPLFLAIIAYAGVGSVITTNLGKSLVGLNYERLLREADLRFSLIRTRENAEAIAFYDGDATREKQGVLELLKNALDTQFGIVTAQRNLEVFTTSYRYLVQILPSLIIAPLYFAHKVELGTISQSYGAFNHILGDFSIIINQFEALSAFSAGLTRLTTFLDKITNSSWEVVGSKSVFNMTSIDIYSSAQTVEQDLLLTVRNLTVLTPDGKRTLIGGIHSFSSSPSSSSSSSAEEDTMQQQHAKQGIDFNLRAADRLLIVGPSGAGKSSFIRAVSGLWRVGSGEVTWYSKKKTVEDPLRKDTGNAAIAPADVFFLPQKPYNVMGSLRQQIAYPNIIDDSIPDEAAAAVAVSLRDQHMLDILREVQLETLASRMGGLSAVHDWSKVLSLGEQQRLAFARVCYTKPSVVFLDEATSALDLDNERIMYAALKAQNVTYVSVGHRPSLLAYHNKKLVLKGPGQQPVTVTVTENDCHLSEHDKTNI